MELALNLAWLCVAIAGLVMLVRTLSRAAAPVYRPASNWRKILAMSCTLVILFFVISMTDDLHDQEILLEETKSSRIVPGTAASSPTASDRTVPLVFLAPCPGTYHVPELPAARRRLEPSEVLFAAAIHFDEIFGRAPPASLA